MIQILARWVRELQCDLADARHQLAMRDRPRWFTRQHAAWLDRYDTDQLVDMARELEAV